MEFAGFGIGAATMLFGLYLSYRRGMWVGVLIVIIGWFIFVFGSFALISATPAHAVVYHDGLIGVPPCVTQECVDEEWRAEQRQLGHRYRDPCEYLKDRLKDENYDCHSQSGR
jgi:hypothetical protein